MYLNKRGICLFLSAFLVASAAGTALGKGANVNVLGSILDGKAEMAKAAAAMVNAQAALVRAISEAQLNQAKAIQTMEQTRTIALDNNLKATVTFYEKRKLYEAYHSLQAVRERPTQEDLIRFSKEAAPERPAPSELSRGVIHWPETLQRDEFLVHRIQLDSLFAKRSQDNSGVGSSTYRKVQTVSNQMREELKDVVQQVSPAEYLSARKFIESLAYEAQFPPDTPDVAVR